MGRNSKRKSASLPDAAIQRSQASNAIVGGGFETIHARKIARPEFDRASHDGVFLRVFLIAEAMDQTPIADLKFEAALAELEAIVASMEGGPLELEASIAAYRRGMELMQHCQTLLADAEGQIRILENGELREIDRMTLENQ